MTSVTGILVTYQRPSQLEAHLAALCEQTRPPDRLIVVDNSPTPVGKAVARGLSMDVEYIAAKENLGPAGGLALGQRVALEDASAGAWLLNLDDDNPPWHAQQLSELHADCEAATDETDLAAIGIAGARLTRLGRLQAPSDEELEGARLVFVDYLGGNQLPHYRLEAVRSVGTFRADLFFGCEELEFGMRLRSHGYRLASSARRLSDSRTRWSDLRSGTTAPPASWRQYYNARNGLRVLLDAAPPLTAACFAASQVAGALRQAARTGSFRGGPQARLHGLRDGLRGRMGRTVEPTGTPQ